MNFSDLKIMAPEILLAISFLMMIIADIYLKNKKIIAYLSVPLLLLAAFLVGRPGSALFFFMYVNDAYAIFFKYLILICGAIAIALASSYKKTENENEGEFYYLIIASTLAMTLLASAVDFILIYVMIEFVSLSSYILTGFLKTDSRSSEGALKYFLIGALSSSIMLFGMSLVYGVCGTTNILAAKAVAETGAAASPLFITGMIFILAGFGFKAALAPFHFWSPDAYEGAPTPITALLSVGPKCAAFAVFGRIIYTVYPALSTNYPELLTAMGILTMTLGNTAAIWQKDVKRMMAYSSIAQAGYVFIGIAAGAEAGFPGMLYYLMAYLFMNLGAFAIIISVVNETGSSSIDGFHSMSKRSPWLSAALIFFFLSLAGIPPTAGFMGKFFLFTGALKSQFYMLAIFGVINSVISVYYYFNVVKTMYFTTDEKKTTVTDFNPGFAICCIVGICVLFTLAAGIYPEPFIRFTANGINFLKTI